MPDWYAVTGRLTAFDKAAMLRWQLFAETRNTRVELKKHKLDPRRWHAAPRRLRPGETLRWRIHAAAFALSTPTLGRGRPSKMTSASPVRTSQRWSR